MNFTEVIKDTTYRLEIFVTDENGDPKSGLSVTYNIDKSSNNSLVDSGSMNDIGDGVYQKAITFDTLGQFRVVYTTPSTYTDEIETVMVIVEVATQEDLLRVLGLVQENYRIFNPSYDRNNNMTSATIKIYSSASDVDTDTNPIAQYQVTSAYDGRNRMTAYRVKKI